MTIFYNYVSLPEGNWVLYSLMWVKQSHVYHPPAITTNTHKYTMFIGGSFTTPSHGGRCGIVLPTWYDYSVILSMTSKYKHNLAQLYYISIVVIRHWFQSLLDQFFMGINDGIVRTIKWLYWGLQRDTILGATLVWTVVTVCVTRQVPMYSWSISIVIAMLMW